MSDNCPVCGSELKADNPSLGTLGKVEIITARCPSCGWNEKRSEVVV